MVDVVKKRGRKCPRGHQTGIICKMMTDEAIIELYWNREESAIPETDLKYGGYCHSVAYNILQSFEDTKECLNDTWLRTWNAIPPTRPSNLRIFLAKIARNLAFDRYRAEHSAKRGAGEMPLCIDELSETVAGTRDVSENIEVEELGRAISGFIRSLPELDGNMFIRRYFYIESSAEISQRFGLKENNVNVRLSRVRKRLKAFLEKEGYI